MRFPGIGTWIERRVDRSGDDVALVAGGDRLTYRDLAVRTRSAIGFLRERGVGPGDRVAFHGRNDPLALTSLFAATAIGAAWVPIHPARPEDEVRSILDDSEPRLLLRAAPEVRPDVTVPSFDAEDIGDAAPDEAVPDVDADELAILAYTSGTAGAPKGVVLTHGNVLWNVVQMLAACGFTSADVALAAAPFTRMGGLGVAVLPTLFAGGTVVVPDAGDGDSVLATVEEQRVTVVFANPDLLAAMVRAPGWRRADLSNVRTGVVGGGLVPEALLGAYLDRGVRLRHGYGLTEASPAVSLLDDRDAASHARTVGRPLPFVEVRTVRPDGTPCDAGEVGAWWIRGPNVCRGYWRRLPVHDADGWFPTGDVGSVDAQGYLTFVDRASSAIHVSGGTVYPAAVETALYGAPGVAEAAAVEVAGDLVAAVVAAEGHPPDPAALLHRLRTALPGPAVPCVIRVVPEIPRNAAGKVRPDALRRLLGG